MKFLVLLFLFAWQSNALNAQNNVCRDDTTNTKLNKSLERSYNCDQKFPPLDPKLSYNENLRQNKKTTIADQRQQSVDEINAFVKPHNYSRINTRKSDERYQFNLDNFRIPKYTCVLPEFDDSDSAIFDYHQDIITELHKALDEHFNCLIASDQSNRELFKQLIVQGLDGKILSSEPNTIEWAVFPKYQNQTNVVIKNINKLYEQRYSNYVDTHNKLRSVIKRYNNSLPSSDE